MGEGEDRGLPPKKIVFGYLLLRKARTSSLRERERESIEDEDRTSVEGKGE